MHTKQFEYILAHPKPIPKLTLIKTIALFDNSRDNPLNPNPNKTIRWGEPSNTEMMGSWIEYIDANGSGQAGQPANTVVSGSGLRESTKGQPQ
jgi:hypothetical protein